MAGSLNQTELLTLFPVKTLPSVAHGRSRSKTRKTAHKAHGRSRHHRAPLVAAVRDPWRHKSQAKGQG